MGALTALGPNGDHRRARSCIGQASLYAWALRHLAGIAAARGTTDPLVTAVRPLVERGTLPSPTWRDLARTLEGVASVEALRLLRRIPARHREAALRDDTLEALTARNPDEPSPEPPGPVDLTRITTFRQARALACELLAPELFLRASLEGREPAVPDELVHHVLYDGMGAVILALAVEGRRLDDCQESTDVRRASRARFWRRTGSPPPPPAAGRPRRPEPARPRASRGCASQ